MKIVDAYRVAITAETLYTNPDIETAVGLLLKEAGWQFWVDSHAGCWYINPPDMGATAHPRCYVATPYWEGENVIPICGITNDGDVLGTTWTTPIRPTITAGEYVERILALIGRLV